MYAMLDHAHLPYNLWGKAALCAGYLFNHSKSHALEPSTTSFEMLHGKKPDISHLQVFGA
ncbi:uncharacterized protein BJ212DRAFT_1286065 [Suillus subaureus]|uniref:Uncharacterized protein n=1 Tax=Suillus subaureus TaxID=48587 RepID=A0A9P7DT05_9AGAM|nr:uncharacterized protein BJ212DRAFT_1286065 [Suillus subaureus]KAG1802325.1 hypothetical protein BJ212DRAFT_1286065 [Suillus subaureus]